MVRNLSSAPALGHRGFRILWLSSALNAMGFVGEVVAQGWVLLEMSGSPFIVGVGMSMRAAPIFFLGILAGTLADRVDRRSLLLGLNLALAGVMGTVSLVILNNRLEVWHLLVAAVLVGSLWAGYQAARQSFVHDIVGPRDLMGGLTFISLAMRAGGIVGALALGFLLDRGGVGMAYLMIGLSYVASAGVLMLVPPRRGPSRATQASVWRDVAELGRELRGNRALLTLVVTTAAVEVLGFSHQVLLPSLARDVLQVGPEGLGVMNAFRSVGGMVALLVLLAVRDPSRKGALFCTVMLLFGVGLVLLGNVSTFVVALVAIALVNGMAALSDVLSQGLVQTVVSEELRGRALGSWLLAVGTSPLGQLQMGALASALGVAFALTANGVALVGLAIGCLALAPRLRRL
jgi:MFS family permease